MKADHLERIMQGIDVWNAWRAGNPSVRPDLRQAPLSGADLAGADLSEADLYDAQLEGSDLTNAKLNIADLTCANLTGAKLRKAYLPGARLSQSTLDGACLSGADLEVADLRMASLRGTDLSKAHMDWSNLAATHLEGANLRGTHLCEANLEGARLCTADLTGAILRDADLSRANLTGAILIGADLEYSNMVRADLTSATVEDCRVFGMSAWGLTLTDGTRQRNLVVTARDEPEITVDDIEVAQVIYLLLHNKKIHDIINTITSRAVLILGRFTPAERKQVLDDLRDALRAEGLVPILFDFERPPGKTLTETIVILAGLSRFVIVDITNPRSSPLELQATMPVFPIPFVPIVQEGEEPFSMFRDLDAAFGDTGGRMLKLLRYPSSEILVQVLTKAIIEPAQRLAEELAARKSAPLEIRDARAYLPPRTTT